MHTSTQRKPWFADEDLLALHEVPSQESSQRPLSRPRMNTSTREGPHETEAGPPSGV